MLSRFWETQSRFQNGTVCRKLKVPKQEQVPKTPIEPYFQNMTHNQTVQGIACRWRGGPGSGGETEEEAVTKRRKCTCGGGMKTHEWRSAKQDAESQTGNNKTSKIKQLQFRAFNPPISCLFSGWSQYFLLHWNDVLAMFKMSKCKLAWTLNDKSDQSTFPLNPSVCLWGSASILRVLARDGIS